LSYSADTDVVALQILTAAKYNAMIANVRELGQVFAAAGNIPYAATTSTLGSVAKPANFGLLRHFSTGTPSVYTPGGAGYVVRSNSGNTDFDSFPLFAATSVGRTSAYSVTAGGYIMQWDTEYSDELSAWSIGSPSAIVTALGSTRYCVAQVGIRTDASVNYVLAELLYTSSGTIRAARVKTGPLGNNVPVYIQLQSFPISTNGYMQLNIYVDGGTTHTGLTGLEETWMIMYQTR
jgi:hypothetical protein